MIKIKNNIGKGIDCSILYKGTCIGKCSNILSFYDVLCQIKKERSNDYQLLVKSRMPNGDLRDYVYKISSDGKIKPTAFPNVRLWNDILDNQLLFLSGYLNNVIYDNETNQ